MTTAEQHVHTERLIEEAAFNLGKREALDALVKSKYNAAEFARVHADGGNPTMAACFLALTSAISDEEKARILLDAYKKQLENDPRRREPMYQRVKRDIIAQLEELTAG